jgi:hypothetical protein
MSQSAMDRMPYLLLRLRPSDVASQTMFRRSGQPRTDWIVPPRARLKAWKLHTSEANQSRSLSREARG